MEIIAYIASALIGISLGLIGGGGSIMTVPVLVYLFGTTPMLATSYSLFIVGSVIGGVISYTLLNSGQPLQLAPATVKDLSTLGIHFDGQLNPSQLFSLQALSVKNIILMLFGGLLVGFGSRYAGGCTSGHAISGLSNLQLPPLVAIIGFFAGGLIMTHLLLPLIF